MPKEKETFELELPNPSELAAGNFLTAKDIGRIKTVVIAEAPHKVPSNFPDTAGNPQMRMRVSVKVPGVKGVKLWTMNNTTYKTLYNEFGKNPKAWVGKKVQISVVPQMVRGKMTNVLYGDIAH